MWGKVCYHLDIMRLNVLIGGAYVLMALVMGVLLIALLVVSAIVILVSIELALSVLELLGIEGYWG